MEISFCRIERQRLIELPAEGEVVDTAQEPIGEERHTAETRRILQEIEKINTALGYTRRAFSTSSKSNSNPNSNAGYFYPRATYGPAFLLQNQKHRNSSPYILKKIVHHTYEFVPSLFNQQSYFYPTPYLQVPSRDKPRRFREIDDESESNLNQFLIRPEEEKSESYRTISDEDIAILNQSSNGVRDGKSMKVKGSRPESSLMQDFIDVISGNDDSEENTEKLHNDKFMKGKRPKAGRQEMKVEPLDADKTFPGLNLNGGGNSKPAEHKKPAGPHKAPNKNQNVKDKPIKKPAKIQEPKPESKHPFMGIFQPNQVAKDAIREGGIVIQRLKVRKGGIAIAGPGGVATAGSGGTAIVGPGGVAFTHPLGLTIAGPGARIYSVPESTDLQQLALQSSQSRGRNFPNNGILVATGPIVYYSPPTTP